MRMTSALIGAVALAGVLAGPVHADCATDIKSAEAAAAKADAKTRAAAEKHITEAKKHLQMGHEDVCEQHLAQANAALKIDDAKNMKPAAGSDTGY